MIRFFVTAISLSILVLGGLKQQILAQAGVSSASVSRTRAQSNASQKVRPNSSNRRNSGRTVNSGAVSNPDYHEPATAFVPPDDIAVEEFINYHKHRLPLPKASESVAMDVRWGNDSVSPKQPEAILQIGFTTAEVNDNEDLRPLNLSLVIDKSGSMQAADKMARVKDALHALAGQLRRQDIVSIVVFDTTAEVLLPAAEVGDARGLRRAIDSIQPDGSTNIHGGLMLGYREAEKNFDRAATNRVILLTDGIANQGVVNPQQIARESLTYNKRGIDLSTIGVGLELDKDLLRTLAKSGRGLFHFVGETEDVEKIFVSEVQSLMSPVARNVELSVEFDNSLRLEKVFGYAPQRTANSVKIPLENMNNGLTAVALMRFRIENAFEFETANVVVRLRYFDLKQKRTIEKVEQIELKNQPSRRAETALLDVEVKKNYTIALLAQSLADMTAAAKSGNLRQAESLLDAATNQALDNYPRMTDKDIAHVFNIVADYQNNLRRANN